MDVFGGFIADDRKIPAPIRSLQAFFCRISRSSPETCTPLRRLRADYIAVYAWEDFCQRKAEGMLPNPEKGRSAFKAVPARLSG